MTCRSIYTYDECGRTVEVEFGESVGWIIIMYKGVNLVGPFQMPSSHLD